MLKDALGGRWCYLKGFPPLELQFGHLFPHPAGDVWDGNMNDVFEENGKVLSTWRGRRRRERGKEKREGERDGKKEREMPEGEGIVRK